MAGIPLEAETTADESLGGKLERGWTPAARTAIALISER